MKKYIVTNSEPKIIDGRTFIEVPYESDTLEKAVALSLSKKGGVMDIFKKIGWKAREVESQ